MKKLRSIAFVCVVLLWQNAVQAQVLKNFFADGKVGLTYLGVDFSQMRYLNDPKVSAADVKNKYIPGINDQIVNNPRKFDVAGFMRRDIVRNDLQVVTKRNEAIDTGVIISKNAGDTYRLQQADLEQIVSNYSGKGIGLLFIVESLDRNDWRGALYLVLIDLDTQKPLLSQRYVKEGRAGLRWATIVLETLEQVDRKDYRKWKEDNS